MKNRNLLALVGLASLVTITACRVPALTTRETSFAAPGSFNNSTDTVNDATLRWKEYFKDPFLISLIDSAVANNQELNIVEQEIQMRKNEIQARKGEYLPFVTLGGAGGIDKMGRYTWDGLSEEDLKANPDKAPKHIGDFMVGAYASWELDVWRKLRTGKQSATLRYLSGIEGKNFLTTALVAEISSSYYELLALDNLQKIIQQSITIQQSALEVVKLQKEAAKETQLAVNRFEAQLLHTQNVGYEIKQRIIEAENRINFLVGRFPQPVLRDSSRFEDLVIDLVHPGLPSQLLVHRPDIRQAEYELSASRLDIKAARANFFPSVRLTAGLGFNSFNPGYLISPKSILYNLAGDLTAPLVNKNAIKATYANAGLKQVSAAYTYERTILNAYTEVVNLLTGLDNLDKGYSTKKKEVDILTQSIDISNSLFRSAHADYLEVLLTQREALESNLELIEIKLKQLQTKVNLYRSLGGGWN